MVVQRDKNCWDMVKGGQEKCEENLFRQSFTVLHFSFPGYRKSGRSVEERNQDN